MHMDLLTVQLAMLLLPHHTLREDTGSVHAACLCVLLPFELLFSSL